MRKFNTPILSFFLMITLVTFNANSQSALQFSGTQKAMIPYNSKLNLGTGAFTFEAVIKAAATGGTVQMILSNRAVGSGGVFVGLYGGHLFTQLGGAAPNLGYSSGVAINDGKCHHVAISRNDTNLVTFYLDGAAYYSVKSATSANSSGNFNIGSDAVDANGDYFNGSIDELRIWNIARSASDIATNATKSLDKAATTSGLVALWSFNEGTGQVASDLTNNGLNATLGTSVNVDNADPTWANVSCVSETNVVVNNTNQALVFGGSEAVTFPSNSKLNLGTGPFTFEANIKASVNGGGVQMILSNRDINGTGGIMFGLFNGKLFTQLGAVAPNLGVSAGVSINDGNCHHVAISRNDTNLITFYLDGAAYYSAKSANSISSVGNFNIGYDADDDGDFFTGTIDEIRIWNLARSSADISAYHNQEISSPTTASGLVALWDFNTINNQVVTDASATKINGVLGFTANVENTDPTLTTNTCIIVTAIEDHLISNQLLIYPNPFENQLNVNTPTPSTIALYSHNGTLVMSQSSTSSLTTLTIDSQLPKGLYFLIVSSGTDTKTYKVVKK